MRGLVFRGGEKRKRENGLWVDGSKKVKACRRRKAEEDRGGEGSCIKALWMSFGGGSSGQGCAVRGHNAYIGADPCTVVHQIVARS